METARAFAEEVRDETKALQSGRGVPLKDYIVEDDADAVNRQSKPEPLVYDLKVLTDAFYVEIRAAILEGDIDKALALTKLHFENVLELNPQIIFRLRCRKFIEIVRSYSEPDTSQASKRTRSGADIAGNNSEDMPHDMELDDQMHDPEAMDITSNNSIEAEMPAAKELYSAREALEYGQQLKADYSEDKRQYEKTLNDIFSLVAYSDPASSPHGHLLDPSGRVAVAEELNAAILGMSLLNPFTPSLVLL